MPRKNESLNVILTEEFDHSYTRQFSLVSCRKVRNGKEKRHTLPKQLRLLRNNPMARIDIRNFGIREEMLYSRQSLLTDVFRLQATNYQRWASIRREIGVVGGVFTVKFPGEIGHFVEIGTQDVQRNAELEGFVVVFRVANQVCQEELADCNGLD